MALTSSEGVDPAAAIALESFSSIIELCLDSESEDGGTNSCNKDSRSWSSFCFNAFLSFLESCVMSFSFSFVDVASTVDFSVEGPEEEAVLVTVSFVSYKLKI